MRKDEKPTATQYKDLIDWLKAKGLSPSVIAQFVGNQAGDRTIAQIVTDLRKMFATLPPKSR